MTWRVVDNKGEEWHVQAAAEMRPDVKVWQLVLAFRARGADRQPRSFWAPYPLESSSKSSLFQAADRLSDDAIRQVLVQHLT
jgi:hypothetical protein